MARRGRTCVAAGCKRRAEAGAVVCADHQWATLDAEAEQEVAQVTRRVEAMSRVAGAVQRRAAAASYREQLDRGAYAAVQPAELLAMLDDAGGHADLTREIGMLRIAMLRVLREEEQPARMAHGLAKLSGALGRAITLQEAREQTAGPRTESHLVKRLNDMMVDIGTEAKINRTPWTVDPYNPPRHVARELERHRLEPGSPEAVLWVEQWRYWLTKKRADDGFEDAREALAEGLVEVHGELGDGLPKRRGSIDTGSGFGDKGWTT